jgi:hypothetical protein
MMGALELTSDERMEILALSDSIGALGEIMQEGGSPEALRMIVATLQAAADALAGAADRWEA